MIRLAIRGFAGKAQHAAASLRSGEGGAAAAPVANS